MSEKAEDLKKELAAVVGVDPATVAFLLILFLDGYWECS